MAGHGPVEHATVIVTVKAAPSLSTKHRETVCVAGVRTDPGHEGEWIRLFPVPFRYINESAQFSKYDEIAVDIQKASDPRPESYSPVDPNRIERVRKLKTWAQRIKAIGSVPVDRTCELQRNVNGRQGRSLGWIEPRPGVGFDMRQRSEEEMSESRKASVQPELFGPGPKALTLPDKKFRYLYRCWDPGCENGHKQGNIDWELAESWRTWRLKYRPEELPDKLRETYLDRLCAPDRETRFFVGNMKAKPNVWMVLGVWWPPKAT